MDILSMKMCFRRARLLALWGLSVGMMLFLTACDPQSKKMPRNFANSIWVCREIPACIAITTPNSFYYGEMEVNGESLPVTMVFYTGNNGAILDFEKAYSRDMIEDAGEDARLWEGKIQYETGAFLLEKASETDTSNWSFSDDDWPLTFVRYDRTQEEIWQVIPWDIHGELKDDFEPGKLLELGTAAAAEASLG